MGMSGAKILTDETHLSTSNDGRTLSATLLVRGPQECGTLRYHWNFTPHDNPFLYTSARREVCTGQRMSVPGHQSYLYERLPIEKLSQPGPYAGPYFTKAHIQHRPKHQGFPIIRPDPLSGHPLGRLLPIHTGVLAQRPCKRIQVDCLTGVRQYSPCGPRAHRERRPRPHHTGSRPEQQKKFKLRTTNGWSNHASYSACQP